MGAVDSRVIKVMDLKTPGSGEVGRNRLQNLEYLAPTDQLKFVLCDRTDYEWARRMVEQHGLAQRCTLLFSPAAGQLDPRALAEWVLEDHLSVRLQLQLHKLIWGDTPGH